MTIAVMRVKVNTILGLADIMGQKEIEMSLPEGSTLGSLLQEMVRNWGEKLSSRLFEHGSDRLLPYIRLMVNGRDIAFLNGRETVLKEEDEVLILPPVSGG